MEASVCRVLGIGRCRHLMLDDICYAKLVFLLSPADRERTSKRANGEIGRRAAVCDSLDDARRHVGKLSEVADVALDLVLASGDRREGVDAAVGEIVHPDAGSRNGGRT